MKKFLVRSCEKCGEIFQPTSSNQRYCLKCRPEVRREQIIEKSRRYYLSHPRYVQDWGKRNPKLKRELSRKVCAKHRSLGFHPLNFYFNGSEGHHINKEDVIYIPKELHRSVWHNQWSGQGMQEINALANQWLTQDWT